MKLSFRAARTLCRTVLVGRATLVIALGVIAARPAMAAELPGSIGPDIDLSRFTQTFADEFDRMSIAARGPGTTWTAHTPWNGDFGDAQFSDPGPGGPFTIADGILSITARKDQAGHWRSGLISSVDALGNGFAQRYGYFEIRAKLPKGKGVWPAFWLAAAKPKGSTMPGLEIDVFEHYGQFDADFHAGVLIWPTPAVNPDSDAQRAVIPVEPGSLSAAFHTWGVDVEPDFITVYFDRHARWRCATPPLHQSNMMILANLALGSGWPIAETPNPSVMQIDYIRAYAPKDGPPARIGPQGG